MSAIFEMAYRAYCENELLLAEFGIAGSKIFTCPDDGLQEFLRSVCREKFAGEFCCRVFEAVAHDTVSFEVSVAPAASKCNDDLIAFFEECSCVL
jgi:hypothetical protein